ncbi:MAG: ComEC/Rec2 family competence protein [Phycisphaerales bacterium]
MFFFVHEDDHPRSKPLRRGVWAFGLLAAGIVLGREWPEVPVQYWLAAAGAAAVAAAVTRGRASLTLLGLTFALLGAAWTHGRLHRVPEDWLPRLVVTEERAIITLTGMVAGEPLIQVESSRWPEPGRPARRVQRWSLDVRGLEVDGRIKPASGEVAVTVIGPPLKVRAGEMVRVTGWWRPPGGPRNPAERDARLVAAQDGLAGSMVIDDARLVTAEPAPTGLSDRGAAAVVRSLAWLCGGFASLLEEPGEDAAAPTAREAQTRATLTALLVGRYDPAVREVSNAWARLGLVHALSISGFHIMVFAWTVLLLVRLTGDRGWVEPVLVALLVVTYLLIVPARAPMVRSGVMVLALLAAEALGRRYDRVNLLAWIGAALLTWRPLDLWDPGFQLSFGVTAALLWLAGPFYEHWFQRGVRGRVRELDRGAVGWLGDKMKELLSAGIVAWGVSVPLVMYHAGVLSVLTPLTGVLVAPLVNLVLIVGYMTLAARLALRVIGFDAPWLLTPLQTIADGLVQLTLWIDRLPGIVWYAPAVSGWWTAAATGVAVWWLSPDWDRSTRVWRWLATGACALWLGLTILVVDRPDPTTLVRADALALGDGSCVLVRSQGEALLVDCGSKSEDRAQWLIPRALRELGASRIGAIVLTHPATEHWSAIIEVVERFGVRDVLVAEGFLGAARSRPDGPPAAMLHELAARGVAVRAVGSGDVLEWDDARAAFVVDPAHPEQLAVCVRGRRDSPAVIVGTSASGKAAARNEPIGATILTGVVRSIPTGLRGERVVLGEQGQGLSAIPSGWWSLSDGGAATVSITSEGPVRIAPATAP